MPPRCLRTLCLLAAAFLLSGAAAFAQLRVTTWNLNWFPDGSQKGASAEVQAQRIQAAADTLRKIDSDALLLQEVRDYAVCVRLAEAIKPNTYSVAVCSAFREPFVPGDGIGRQQVAILVKTPALAAWTEKWKALGRVDPPRGFAFAWLRVKGRDYGVYCVHLKSNLVRGDDPNAVRKNILKRELATSQLAAHLKDTLAKVIPTIQTVVVGGDFNTNIDEPAFAEEQTLTNLTAAGFTNCWSGVPLEKRITHPKNGRYPGATFDYLFLRGGKLNGPAVLAPAWSSDHQPVTVEVSPE